MQVASSSGSTSGFELSVDSTVQRIVAAAADLAFIVDRDGVVVDVWRGEVFSGLSGWEALVGQPWGDTVAIDTRARSTNGWATPSSRSGCGARGWTRSEP
jgi:hypothetical protein